MKINITNHAIRKAIERVWKVETKLQAIDYIKEKFNWMYEKQLYKYRKVHNWKADKDTFYITNWFHRLIYTFLESWEVLIISYMRIMQYKNIKSKKSKFKRILEIIFE